MKNIKTTLAGWGAGLLMGLDAVIQAATTHQLDGKSGRELALAVLLILLGTMAKDHNTTGGTVQQ